MWNSTARTFSIFPKHFCQFSKCPPLIPKTNSFQNQVTPLKQMQIRSIRTSPKMKAVPPLLWMIIKPVAKFTAILTGRGFRKWWRSLPKNKRAYFLFVLKKNQFKIAASSGIVSAACAGFYFSHLQEVPFMSRKRFVAFTPQQFQQISQFEFKSICEEHKDKIVPEKHPAHQRVLTAAKRLFISNTDIPEIANQHWSVVVVNDPMENAFVLPSGHIFFFTGMLDLCANDSQLGVVLGHEMAHAVLGHGPELVSFAHLLDLVMIVVLAAIWAFLPSDGISVITQWFFHKVTEILMHLPYNRMLENEADEFGLRLAAKACFDVRESSAFWTKMEVISALKEERNVEWLSTHPNHESRSKNLEDLMPHAIQTRSESNCAKLGVRDPRIEVNEFKESMMNTLMNTSKNVIRE